jgi:hypothetical protein
VKAPEPPRQKPPFHILATEIRGDIKAQNPQLSAGEIAKLIGGAGRKLTPAEQAPYVEVTSPPASRSDGRPEEVNEFSSAVRDIR